MSADEAAGKVLAARPAAAFTSSFINKNTTGKKFAPKAARRRPAAGPPAPPNVDAQDEPAEATAPAQLPTPTATQESGAPHIAQATAAASEAATVATAPSPSHEPAAPASQALPTPPSTATVPPVVDGQPRASPRTADTGHVVQDGADAGRAAKRRRVDHAAPDTIQGGESPAYVPAAQPDPPGAASSLPPQTTAPTWVAVNPPQQVEDDEEKAPAPATKTRKPPKPRGQKNAKAPPDEADQQEAGEGEAVAGGDAQPVRQRSAKARGKRRVDEAVDQDGTGEEDVAGRTVDEAVGQAEDGEPVVRQKPKPRQPKRRPAATKQRGEELDPIQPKGKGRPPREPTPEDAEQQEIDPETTFMKSIASRNIGVGKLSNREKAMREIDWEDVRRRRREEDSRKITSRAELEAAEKLQVEEAPVIEGPRYVMVDGQIQLLQPSTMIDREAEADREIENYEVVEERSLTTRITTRSFLKNNKRFPNDFMLPGQGKRWTAADTELFYEGLQHFGTDFQMISHMFPGSTRRSIKLKFTREERDDPARVREILQSRSTINSNWDAFMQVSQMDEDKLADADEIKRQLAEEEAEFKERIAAAKAETEERKRQQREAGLLDDEDENGDPGNKENGKGKKKRKGKDKQVTFQEEVGVEIVGNVDDDATWGQE